MPGEGVDHVVPILPVAGRGDVAFVGKDAVGAAGEGFWHEAELDEGADAVVEHEVVDLIDVEEVEVACAGGGNAHLVVEEAVAADRLHSGVAAGADQIFAPLVAEADDGAVRSGGFLPKMWKGTADFA